MKFKITVDVDTEDKTSVSDIEETVSAETEETITVEEPAGEAPQTEPARITGDEDEIEFVKIFQTRQMSLKTMENMVRDKELKTGDQLEVELDGEATYWDVIGIDVDHPSEDAEMEDHTYVTVQSHDLLEEREFDEGNSNVWKNSSLRAYLNSDVFASRFDDEFRKHMVKTCVGYGTKDPTIDDFFLLSKDDYDPKKTRYPYYRNVRNRVKFGPDDRTNYHWTRSSTRDSACKTWCVGSTGSVYNNGASSALRFAPACVLIF